VAVDYRFNFRAAAKFMHDVDLSDADKELIFHEMPSEF